MVLPSYEEALREANGPGSNRRGHEPGPGQALYRHHGQTGHRSGRHHPVQAEVVQGHVKHYVRGQRQPRGQPGQTRADPDTLSHSSTGGQCVHTRQQSGSNSGSLRSVLSDDA